MAVGSQKPWTVVVLAAGRSTRMASSIPKVCQAIAGAPIIHHIVHTVLSCHPDQILVVVNPDHQAHIQQALGEAQAQVRFVPQDKACGTGHALQCALPHIPTDHQVLVLLGDVPFVPAGLVREAITQSECEGLTLVGMKPTDPTGFGRLIFTDDQRVRAIVEERDADEEIRAVSEVFTGIMAGPAHFMRQALQHIQPHNAQGEYYLTDLVGLWAQEAGGCAWVMAEQTWQVLGVNTMAQLAQLEKERTRARLLGWMAAGVRVMDPDRVVIRGEVTVAADAVIDVGVVLEGQVTIGAGAVLGPYTVIKDSDVAARAEIKAHSVLEGVTVGEEASVGPMAYLRPGSSLEDTARVGAFVEVKNSRLSPGVKVNHLSYIGDADLGCRVNIGAGTITANYDGAHKHRTVIEDDCHIGANNTLIAPICVGRGATTGGGSTLTHDVPPGLLAVARAKVRCLAGWRRPQKDKD